MEEPNDNFEAGMYDNRKSPRQVQEVDVIGNENSWKRLSGTDSEKSFQQANNMIEV